MPEEKSEVSVVIPCYRAREYILGVLASIGAGISRITVVDDGCPNKTGEFVKGYCTDPRVTVLFHAENLGVGGAVKTGYRRALEERADIVIKIDGDGQMDTALIPAFIECIRSGRADYVKGNRFMADGGLSGMPRIRFLGNKMFSAMSRAASGCSRIDDVLNGFTAVDGRMLARLPLDDIANDYFFESDMIYFLARENARIEELPTPPRYAGARSSLSIPRTLLTFPPRYFRQWWRRGMSHRRPKEA